MGTAVSIERGKYNSTIIRIKPENFTELVLVENRENIYHITINKKQDDRPLPGEQYQMGKNITWIKNQY